MKDANGNLLTKEMKKDWLRFQKNFDRVKDLIKKDFPEVYEAGERVSYEISKGKLSGKDRRFYNNFVGSEWGQNPITVDEAGRIYYFNYNYEEDK